jgi:hypothetical protein
MRLKNNIALIIIALRCIGGKQSDLFAELA